MRKLNQAFVFGLVLFSASATAAPARAEGPALHYAQAGALLAYAEAEIRILYAAISAKEFDPSLTKSMVDELSRTFVDAKRRVERSASLLDEKDAALEPDLQKLREAVKKCEDTLTKLATDIEEQTGKGDDDEKKDDDDEEGSTHDWELLKAGTGWLAVDLQNARSMYANLSKKMKSGSLALPPKPKGKRD